MMMHVYEDIFFWLPVLVVTVFWGLVMVLACRRAKHESATGLLAPPDMDCLTDWPRHDFSGPGEPLTSAELRTLVGDSADNVISPAHFTQEGTLKPR